MGTGRSVPGESNDSDTALARLGSRGEGKIGGDDDRSVRRTSCRDFAGILPATRAFIATPGLRLASSPVRRKQSETVMEDSHKNSPNDST